MRPCIVPLRPLGLGDIISGGTGLIRFNPKTVLGISLIVQLALALITVPTLGRLAAQLDTVVYGDAPSGSDLFRLFAPTILESVLRMIAAMVMSGLLAYVTIEAVAGSKPSIGDTWRAASKKLLPFLGAQALLVVGQALLIALLVGLAVALSTANQGLSGAVIGLGFLVLAPLLLWANVRLGFLGPAIMIENTTVVDSYRRSFALTKGQFWRMFGIQIVASLLAGFAAGVLAYPFQFFGAFLLGEALPENGVFGALALNALMQSAVMALIGPFLAAVTNLLYVDQRIRKEGFDLTLMTSPSGLGRAPWTVP